MGVHRDNGEGTSKQDTTTAASMHSYRPGSAWRQQQQWRHEQVGREAKPEVWLGLLLAHYSSTITMCSQA